jgi:hypothetical protein
MQSSQQQKKTYTKQTEHPPTINTPFKTVRCHSSSTQPQSTKKKTLQRKLHNELFFGAQEQNGALALF